MIVVSKWTCRGWGSLCPPAQKGQAVSESFHNVSSYTLVINNETTVDVATKLVS